MTNYDDEAPQIEGHLKSQLWRIAEVHRGEVPLHGRLFSQWLHYTFPRECPLPHKQGTTISHDTPYRRADSFTNWEEISRHTENTDVYDETEMDILDQWTEDEELVGTRGYNLRLQAPWERKRGIYASCALLGLFAVFLVGFKSKPRFDRREASEPE